MQALNPRRMKVMMVMMAIQCADRNSNCDCQSWSKMKKNLSAHAVNRQGKEEKAGEKLIGMKSRRTHGVMETNRKQFSCEDPNHSVHESKQLQAILRERGEGNPGAAIHQSGEEKMQEQRLAVANHHHSEQRVREDG